MERWRGERTHVNGQVFSLKRSDIDMEVDKPKKEEETKESSEAKAKGTAAAKVITLEDLREQCRWIERADIHKEPRFVTRVLRSLGTARKRIDAVILSKLVSLYFSSPNYATQKQLLLGFLPSKQTTTGETPAKAKAARSPPTNVLPEVEAYIHLLIAIYLLDAGKLDEAEKCVGSLVERISVYNRRSLDPLSARAYYYYALVAERQSKLAPAREFLHTRLRTATLRHDDASQATIINCLLRSYLLDGLYDVASKLQERVAFPESANNNEWARYLFYWGRIEAMQLHYAQARIHMTQALRKSPQNTAAGFKQIVQKFSVVVELLLGEIPERALFRQPMYRRSLQPYFVLTQVVRTGDVAKFNEILKTYEAVFVRDATFTLVVRLRQNVIRTAVKRIALAYSSISVADVAQKLQLQAAADAESIVSKAICDNVIDAILVHEGGDAGGAILKSRERSDVYSTGEPQRTFHSRIAFCLELRNQCVKAMRFPPKSYNKDLETAQERREREQQDLELAKEMAEEEDDFA